VELKANGGFLLNMTGPPPYSAGENALQRILRATKVQRIDKSNAPRTGNGRSTSAVAPLDEHDDQLPGIALPPLMGT
jgi:hypothetical protein